MGNVWVAVGTALSTKGSGCPPHRSRRAELPHRAPASGQTRKRCSTRQLTCRIRSSALCRAARSCARSLFCWAEFPLARPLSSTPSAEHGAPHPLFEGFPGTMGLSDFPRSYIIGLPPRSCRYGSGCHSRPNMGSPGSRSRCLDTCTGSPTARGPRRSRDNDRLGVAFRFRPRRRHPELVSYFRGSIPGLHLPLSTLRRRSYPRRRMTRSLCDSLDSLDLSK